MAQMMAAGLLMVMEVVRSCLFLPWLQYLKSEFHGAMVRQGGAGGDTMMLDGDRHDDIVVGNRFGRLNIFLAR